MRIGYFVSLYPAPSHTFIRREVTALRDEGFNIETFSLRSEQWFSLHREHPEQLTWSVLPVRPLSLIATHLYALRRPLRYIETLRLALEHRVPGVKALIWSIFHFVEAIVLARKLRDREIAHLHCHFANAGATVGMLAAHFERIPWSLTLHGISETDYPAGILLARKIARARFAACVSYFGQAQAMRVVPYDHWHKFFISRCGLDLEALPPKSSAARNRMRIICVGRLSPEKGHFGLLEAFRMALQQGVDAELVLVGTGPFERDLVSAVQSLELDRAVSFLGKLDEQRTLEAIASSDILVLASFMEGLPIVLMEAMALGVPVIGPRVAGTPELIEEGKEGLLFTPANWQELTARIVALAADKSLRSDLSQAARKKIEDDFRVKSAIAPLAKRFRILSTASS